MNGHPNRQYAILPYDPAWSGRFESEADTVLKEFGPDAKNIHHIGSTAVPGMSGKPIVDILLLVDAPDVGDRHAPGLATLGYAAMGEYVTGGSRLFIKSQGEVRLVNLHVFPADHPHVREMLGLRDYFRDHPEAVREYSELKVRLKRAFPNDYAEYRKQKDAWMEELKEHLRAHGIL